MRTAPNPKLEASADIFVGHFYSFKARTSVELSRYFVFMNVFCSALPRAIGSYYTRDFSMVSSCQSIEMRICSTDYTFIGIFIMITHS